MKKQSVLPGIILIGVGTYFLLQKLDIPLIQKALSWPTLLIMIGVSFIIQAYLSKDFIHLFPGIIVSGLGIHFHSIVLFSFWPKHWAMYLFIFSLAFLITYTKTKKGLIPGILLLIGAILGYFYSASITWLVWIGKLIYWLVDFWPVALIGTGLYLLATRKGR